MSSDANKYVVRGITQELQLGRTAVLADSSLRSLQTRTGNAVGYGLLPTSG